MLIKQSAETASLRDLIAELDLYNAGTSFGADIDSAHREMFEEGVSEDDAAGVFVNWAAKYQPCLFGRLGAKESKGVSYDICWLTSRDIEQGDLHLINKIQHARRAWKDRAAQGLASGFLIMFQDRRLAFSKPGQQLLKVCQKIAELYIVEHAPLERDTIYTEAIPLRHGEKYGLFKAGINVFYPGAHRTLNHDRRIPGGLLISVNSPGHLANSLHARGAFPSLKEAVQWIYEIAMHSVGNGGIGHEHTRSASWHNIEHDPAALGARCPLSHRPPHVPENYSGRVYSALYHTDVLLPTDVTVRDEIDPDVSKAEVWPWLVIDYISEAEVSQDHLNYALFHPHPIPEEARYHNPWPPRRAYNSPLFDY
ncbi:hypothetical protein [Burkholderia cepacia]|uniref:hypothetical protein n=1 Tax=Burkholderia cepacia TaxID=292 RepID=UPI002AB789BA|nr:hypothetical protein [Burkholderia cepacia]